MTDELTKLDGLLVQVRNLPPLSAGVTKLLALSPSDAALVEKTKEIVRADPALAAQIIKVANSAAFGGQETVDSVDRAIMRVGVRMVTGAVSQTQIQASFDPHEELTGQIWISNVLAANIARDLAAVAPSVGLEPEEAYTYGLLHDVGRLVMVRLLGPRLQEILDEAPPLRTELAKRERALFGFDHVMAGRLLGNRWRLPAEMTLVIAAHHLSPAERPGCPPRVARFIDLLALVDELAHLAITRNEDAAEIEAALGHTLAAADVAELTARLGVDRAAVSTAMASALADMERQRRVLGVKAKQHA